MLRELTPEQAYELIYYSRIEPFGEVRDDLRFANWIRFYYDTKRGKNGAKYPIGAFTLYEDLQESAEESAGREELEAQLGRFAMRSSSG